MCVEALVFLCGRALRWDICLKSIVVARLTCLCFEFVLWFSGFEFVVLVFVLCGLGGLGGVMWVCGILLCACFLCWAIAGCECSFPFLVLVLIAFVAGTGREVCAV